MFSVRQAAHYFRKSGSWLAASRVIIYANANLETAVSYSSRAKNGVCFHKKDLNSAVARERFFVGSSCYSSQANKTGKNEIVEMENEEDLFSELDSLDGDEKDVSSEYMREKKVAHELLDSIVAAPNSSQINVLRKWAEEGRKLSELSISIILVNLRKQHLYLKALQFTEWLENTKQTDLTTHFYACRLDLISRAHGVEQAEQFFEKIPKSFKDELVYCKLLKCYVCANNVKKAEALFKKMESELPITVNAFNQMIILYKKFDKEKISHILVMMEKKKIKPSLLTYKLLIDVKGQSNNILRMEQLIEKMRADGIEPDINALALIARRYINMGSIEKAETFVKEIEERKQEENYDARRSLLPLYASLGKVDEVHKIWKDCESDLMMKDCMAAIEAWGELGKVEEAEAVFELMHQKWKNLRSKQYSVLLNVFIKNKLVAKGKDLVKQMSDNGLHVGRLTWDALVRLYIVAGDVEKADFILQKAAQDKQIKLPLKTCTAVMDLYAKRGDIHNTEKLFYRMRELGYTGHILPFKILNQAYINAKTPAYGFLERMKADNVSPDEAILRRLTLTDPFRKTAASKLLD